MIKKAWIFAGVVWRPATGDKGDSWLQAWRKYRISVKTAWEIAGILSR